MLWRQKVLSCIDNLNAYMFYTATLTSKSVFPINIRRECSKLRTTLNKIFASPQFKDIYRGMISAIELPKSKHRKVQVHIHAIVAFEASDNSKAIPLQVTFERLACQHMNTIYVPKVNFEKVYNLERFIKYLFKFNDENNLLLDDFLFVDNNYVILDSQLKGTRLHSSSGVFRKAMKVIKEKEIIQNKSV